MNDIKIIKNKELRTIQVVGSLFILAILACYLYYSSREFTGTFGGLGIVNYSLPILISGIFLVCCFNTVLVKSPLFFLWIILSLIPLLPPLYFSLLGSHPRDWIAPFYEIVQLGLMAYMVRYYFSGVKYKLEDDIPNLVNTKAYPLLVVYVFTYGKMLIELYDSWDIFEYLDALGALFVSTVFLGPIVAYSGIWRLKKWGAYLYISCFLINSIFIISSMIEHKFSFAPILLRVPNLIFIGLLIYNLKQKRFS